MVKITIISLVFSLKLMRATLPDPFVITWELETSSFYPDARPATGFAFKDEVGYLFARGIEYPQNIRYNFTDGTTAPYPGLDSGKGISRMIGPCVVPLPNGDIYVIGGSPTFFYDYGPTAHNDEAYKIEAGSNNTYTLARMIDGRFTHSCVYDAVTNRIYAIGGASMYIVNDAPSWVYFASTEYYSIEHNNWTKVADRPYNYRFGATVLVDGNIYVFNGHIGPNEGEQVILKYNIANDTWIELGPTKKPGWNQIAAYWEEENIILLFGGQSSVNDGCEYFNLTSQTSVPFTCLTADNETITGGSYNLGSLGAFVPSSRTFYAVSPFDPAASTRLWRATIPNPPVAEPTTVPTAAPIPAPVSQAPVTATIPISQPVAQARASRWSEFSALSIAMALSFL